jgi:hypothetical protein
VEFVKTTAEKAKAIGRNLRLDPAVQELITNNLKELEEGEGWEINLTPTEKASRTKIKGQIERIATLNGISVAVRTSGTDKLVCWKLSDEEILERKKRGEALQAGRQKVKAEEEAAVSRRRR